jgi:hypothetical protein
LSTCLEQRQTLKQLKHQVATGIPANMITVADSMHEHCIQV